MQEPGSNEKRFDIPYLEGVNALSSFNIAKKTELRHAENARSTQIGSIEKRAGQVPLGYSSGTTSFTATGNYGLFQFEPTATSPATNQGLYRISKVSPDTTASIYYLNRNGSTFSNVWTKLSGYGLGITTGQFDYTPAENSMFLVNHEDLNRYIASDGTTVYTSTSSNGHLYNSPRAHRCNFYKGRLYLANYTTDVASSGVVVNGGTLYVTTTTPVSTTGGSGSGLTVTYTAVAGAITTINGFGTTGTGYKTGDVITVNGAGDEKATFTLTVTSTDYKTSVIRSSFPMGIVALVNEDVTGAASVTVQITDNKYFYEDNGVNIYDVYRGPELITRLTVTNVDEYEITATMSSVVDLKASDEIWIADTYAGSKIMRWPKNPSVSGKDVKQYDSFKLAGGNNDGITMLTNVGNVLMVANKNSMSSWNDYTLENFDLGIGNVSKNGYVKLLGGLYFMHYTGVYVTTGGVPKLISNKVERYITGATKAGLESCAAGRKGRSVFFAIGDVKLYYPDGSEEKTLSGVCLEYNLTQENWFVHTNVKASEFSTFVSEAPVTSEIPNPIDRIVLTDTGGDLKVKDFLAGTTDDGVEIPFRIDFNRMTLNNAFERLNHPIALLLDTERGSAMKVFVSMEEGNPSWYEIDGDVSKGLSVLKVTSRDPDRGTPSPCRLLDVSIRDSSNQICRFNRASVVFLPSNVDAADKEFEK